MITLGWTPLDPITFLDRSALVFADSVALRSDGVERTYGQLAERCGRLGGALLELGVAPGDRVSVLSPNNPMLLETHFGVPAAGAVLNTVNTRLSPPEIATIVDHASSSVIIVDASMKEIAQKAISLMANPPRLLLSGDEGSDGYEAWLSRSSPDRVEVRDEMSPFALNYTSGTTGAPKGVLYSRRGAYLQSLAMALQTGLTSESVYLWVVPMFHCNGWCFPWAVTAAGGTHITPASIDAQSVWRHIREDGVTHLSAAPTVLTALAHSPAAAAGPAPSPVNVTTGGAPPSAALLERLAELGFRVTHLYGLTESYGPAALNEWRSEWDALPVAQASRLRARQGVSNIVSPTLRVVDVTGHDLPPDGRSVGEILLGGNTVMLGYYRDQNSTVAAQYDGWLRTGDLGFRHADGYVELTDRAKDVIISGGENVSSIEVEHVLDAHPAVLESAVVGTPDERWGEIVTAFVTVRKDMKVTDRELTDHVRRSLAGYKVPRIFHFRPTLPRTSTGKVQKALLRRQADGTADAGSNSNKRPLTAEMKGLRQ